jgi:hypothetical protein
MSCCRHRSIVVSEATLTDTRGGESNKEDDGRFSAATQKLAAVTNR